MPLVPLRRLLERAGDGPQVGGAEPGQHAIRLLDLLFGIRLAFAYRSACSARANQRLQVKARKGPAQQIAALQPGRQAIRALTARLQLLGDRGEVLATHAAAEDDQPD